MVDFSLPLGSTPSLDEPPLLGLLLLIQEGRTGRPRAGLRFPWFCATARWRHSLYVRTFRKVPSILVIRILDSPFFVHPLIALVVHGREKLGWCDLILARRLRRSPCSFLISSHLSYSPVQPVRINLNTLMAVFAEMGSTMAHG